MPGAPPSASTASPESSASAGRPEARAAWRALIMAFSMKLRPVSSASSLMNWLCGNTSICAPSMACSSLSLPALLLASTSRLKVTSLIGMELLLETQGMHRRAFIGLYAHLELQQPALASAVVGNEVDGVLLLNTHELEWGGLLQQVLHRAFDPGVHRLRPIGTVALHGDIHYALPGAALQTGSGGDLRLQIGAVEGVVIDQQVAEALRALRRARLGGGGGGGEHQQAGEQDAFHEVSLSAGDTVNGDLAEQVGPHGAQHAAAMGLIHHQTIKDAYRALVTQLLEVLEGAEVDVGCVVPSVRHELGYRHATLGPQVQAAAPMTEVGEGEDCLAADAQQVLEDAVWEVHSLQGLGHDHGIEAVDLEIGQILIEVFLDHIHALADAGIDVVRVDFQDVATHLPVVLHIVQQLALSTAEVQ